MRRLVSILILLTIFACDTTRNTPDPQDKYFLRYYGESGYQEAVDFIAKDDGSFVLLGQSRKVQDGPAQVYLVKVTSAGFVEWKKFFGENELAKDIEISGNGYLILSDSLHDDVSDMLVRMVNDKGDLVQKPSSFSFPGNFNEAGSTITQLYDNGTLAGFIATGCSDAPSDGINALIGKTAIFPRFNQDGTLYAQTWVNYRGTEGNDVGIRVAQLGGTIDSPLSFFGYFNGKPQNDITNNSYNFWVSDMTVQGGGIGTGIVENSPLTDERLSAITPLNPVSNIFLMSGTTLVGGTDRIFLASKNGFLPSITLDIDLGALQSLGDSYKNVSIIPSRSAGYILAANQISADDSDVILVKINSDGIYEWSEASRFGGNGNDKQAGLAELEDGRIVVFGTMQIGSDRQSKMFLMKLNAEGHLRE